MANMGDLTELDKVKAIFDEQDELSDDEYYSVTFKQVKAIGFGGDLFLQIRPQLCPTGLYVCISWHIGSNDPQLEQLCHNLHGYGNNEVCCGLMSTDTANLSDCFDNKL